MATSGKTASAKAPTTSADSDNPEAASTAEVTGGDTTTAAPAPAPAAEQVTATAAGDDGADKILRTAGFQDEFGPVQVGEGDDKTSYTITRAGTLVAGAHVQAVRDSAEHNKVKLRSSKA
jgi:hypothetical protein